MDEFFVRALLCGLGVALVVGPLGTLVVWRRMAYFGDTLAHSALLGVALGFLLEVNLNLSIILVCVTLALLLVAFQRQAKLASDTLLGILSHASLSLGLVVLALIKGIRVDLLSYLFGDILTVTWTDLYWILGGGILVLVLLKIIWRALLALTVHEELALVEGIPVTAVKLIFMVIIALVIAVAMKVVGIILITSLLIIPAATARRFARSPEQMALFAALIGVVAETGGLFASLQWDLPAGPAVVVAAAILFVSAPVWGRMLSCG